MQSQPFEVLVESSLLTSLERQVVENHATLHRDVLRENWSEPTAYHWIRYESADPVARLVEGTQRLLSEWRQLRVSDERIHGIVERASEAEVKTLREALVKARALGYVERE